MGEAEPEIDGALETIDEAILPNLSLLIDGALDAAVLARPGADADAYASELRRIAAELSELTKLMQAAHPAHAVADDLRMSA